MAILNSKTSDWPKIEESIAKLKEIQICFEKNVCRLHQKIAMLYSTPELQNIFESLKKKPKI